MSYSTWGTPTVTSVNGYGDLGFRYLYVGRFDVQWDDFAGAGLHYMHARHFSPEFGRFLQPDPSALEANLYGYTENSPVTKVDPSGLWGPAVCLTPVTAPVCIKVTSDVVVTVWAGVLLLAGVSTSVKSDTSVRVTPKTAPRPPRRSGCWVIGEFQARVEAYARIKGCTTMPRLASTLPSRVKKALNALWVLAEMGQRKHLYDIGPFYNPPKITSAYYRIERTLTAV